MEASHQQSSRGYRPDIDGLRAVSVLSVVLYHAGLSIASGGYVGVDVFFVISGFLISRILLSDIDKGQFSIISFYDRRIRRIMPALAFVTCSTTLAALLFLTPYALERFGKSLMAVALFSSNFFFWKNTSYFETHSHTQLLLHTWSLSVEEQFYLLWPLVLWTLARPGLRRLFLPICAALALVSLIASEYATMKHPAAAFYLLPSRGWEFAIGACLAAPMPRVKARAARELGAAMGLVLVLYCAVVYRADTPFPGLHALWPVLGAAFLIHCGERTWAGTVLSTKAIVFVGLISYSLYLWHWPILTLIREYLDRQLRPSEVLIGLTMSTVLAISSWRFVEQPFRRGKPITARWPPPASVLAAAATIIIGVATGGLFKITRGLPRRGPDAVVAAESEPRAVREASSLGSVCSQDDLKMRDFLACRSTAAPVTLALWGDSHAWAFANALADRGRDSDKGAILYLLQIGCPPGIGATRVSGRLADPYCEAATLRAAEELRRYPSISTLVLVGRWSLYTENVSSKSEGGVATYLTDDSNRELSSANSRRVLRESLDRAMSLAETMNIKVVIVNQVPEFEVDTARCVAHARWWNLPESRCFVPVAYVRARFAASVAIMRELAASHRNVKVIDPLSLFCDDEVCRSIVTGELMYIDDNHLSFIGSKYLLRFIERELDPNTALHLRPAVMLQPL